MYLTVSSVPSNFIHIYVLLTKVKDKSGKKNDVKLLSTRMKRSLPCATPTLVHPTGNSSNKSTSLQSPSLPSEVISQQKLILYYGQLEQLEVGKKGQRTIK